MTCERCGAVNPAVATTCGRCGHQLARLPAGSEDTNPAGAATQAASEPTRYLCAAVQMDGALADQVVRGILREEHRGIAASPDVDLVAVLKHALAGNARRTSRDVALFVALALLIWIILLGQPGLAIFLWLVFSVGVVWFETLYTDHVVIATRLNRSAFRPDDAPSPGSYWAAALAEVAAQKAGNVTVYSGYSPFVGYGAVLDNSWSFALDVTRPAEADNAGSGEHHDHGGRQRTGAPDGITPFTVHELHDHVAAEVRQLGVSGLDVTDRLIVNGRDIRSDRRFLPEPTGRPVSAVPDDLIRSLRAHPEDRARPYLAIRVVGWRGELALTVFLRFLLTESYLFVEASYSVLSPLRERYHAVDTLLPTPMLSDIGAALGRSLLPAVRLGVTSPARILRFLGGPAAERRRQSRERRLIDRNPAFDYGSLPSLREAASDNRYHRYFQQLDKDMYLKVVERRIFDALVDFLGGHGISTSDLVQRQTTILNHGVLVTGQGTLNAESVAAGSGARARTVIGQARAAARGSGKAGAGTT